MVLSYKLPGLEAMTLPLEISATTEEVKEYLRDQHMINRRFNVRIYVQGKAVYLAKEKTLEQSLSASRIYSYLRSSRSLRAESMHIYVVLALCEQNLCIFT